MVAAKQCGVRVHASRGYQDIDAVSHVEGRDRQIDPHCRRTDSKRATEQRFVDLCNSMDTERKAGAKSSGLRRLER